MSTIQPEFTMRQYASKDDMIGAMRQHIAELESRVQELGQMARDVNSRRVVELEAQLASIGGVSPPEGAELITAAQAVVDRWDTPLWKDVPATAEYIGRLRAALASAPAQPVAEPDAAYATLPAPESYGTRNGQIDPKQPLFTEDDMRAFADATCALRIKSRATGKAEHDARHRLAMTMAGGGA